MCFSKWHGSWKLGERKEERERGPEGDSDWNYKKIESICFRLEIGKMDKKQSLLYGRRQRHHISSFGVSFISRCTKNDFILCSSLREQIILCQSPSSSFSSSLFVQTFISFIAHRSSLISLLKIFTCVAYANEIIMLMIMIMSKTPLLHLNPTPMDPNSNEHKMNEFHASDVMCRPQCWMLDG